MQVLYVTRIELIRMPVVGIDLWNNLSYACPCGLPVRSQIPTMGLVSVMQNGKVEILVKSNYENRITPSYGIYGRGTFVGDAAKKPYANPKRTVFDIK